MRGRARDLTDERFNTPCACAAWPATAPSRIPTHKGDVDLALVQNVVPALLVHEGVAPDVVCAGSRSVWKQARLLVSACNQQSRAGHSF